MRPCKQHAAYVEEVRKRLRRWEEGSLEDFGTKITVRLTGDAYYTAKFGQMWLRAKNTFGDGTPTVYTWYCLDQSLDNGSGLVGTGSDDVNEIAEGWYTVK